MPRRYLLVWTGGEFRYPHRLAVDSIRVADPAATVEVHVLGRPPTTPHFTALATSDRQVEVHSVDRDRLFRVHPGLNAVFDAIAPEAHSARSNLLRYALVHRRGGVYVDFDVLLRRPIHELGGERAFVGVEQVWRHDRPRLEGRYRAAMVPGTVGWAIAWAARRADTRWFGGLLRMAERLRRFDSLWSDLQPNNAVLGGQAGGEFTGLLLDTATRVDPAIRYSLGPSLVADVASAHPRTVRLLPEFVCYPVPPSESHRFFDDRTLRLRPETALIHYVNSNHRALLARLEPGDPRFVTRPEVFWQTCRDVQVRRATQLATLDARPSGPPLAKARLA